MNISVNALCENDILNRRETISRTLFDCLISKKLPQDVVKTWKDICLFNLECEKAYLIRSFHYKEEHATEMEVEYRKFMFLRIQHVDEVLPMSKDVDDFWHVHVMNTRNYHFFIETCANGIFIHHRPTISDEENKALMSAYLNGTLMRYREYFGEPPNKFWKKDPTTACCIC